jgi:hypothetical protein
MFRKHYKSKKGGSKPLNKTPKSRKSVSNSSNKFNLARQSSVASAASLARQSNSSIANNSHSSIANNSQVSNIMAKKSLLDKTNPIDILRNLDANIFGTVKQTSINCNILFLKNMNDRGIYHYTIKTDDRIYTASKEEIVEIQSLLKNNGSKLCSYDVSDVYMDEQYDTSTFSFILLSSDYITYDLRKRHKQSLVLCGILFLNEVKNSKRRIDKNINLYLPLICSKPGLGGLLINYAEILGTLYGYHKLLLTSIDKPFGFYLYKQYQLEKGTNTYDIDSSVKVSAFKKTANKKLSVNNRLKHLAHFRNNNGLVRSYNNLASILPKEITQNSVERNRFLKSGIIDSLHGIKKDDDGIHMFKILNPEIKYEKKPKKK